MANLSMLTWDLELNHSYNACTHAIYIRFAQVSRYLLNASNHILYLEHLQVDDDYAD